MHLSDSLVHITGIHNFYTSVRSFLRTKQNITASVSLWYDIDVSKNSITFDQNLEKQKLLID